MKEKEKLIVTLWRGQVQNSHHFQYVFCRLTYNNQQHNTSPVSIDRALIWKETFVFSLASRNQTLRLDFINMQKDQQIHFARDQVLENMSLGKTTVLIDLDNSNRGTVPAKLPIVDMDKNPVGTIFFEFQVLKTEVTHIVEKVVDYEYSLKMSDFRLTFTRDLATIPNFYLKFIFGKRSHKEDFPFQKVQNVFKYNYPVKIYIKSEDQIDVDIQTKGVYQKDKKNFNMDFDSQIFGKPKNKGKKKNQLDLSMTEKIYSTIDLTYKKDITGHRKIPVNMLIRTTERQIGSLEFDFQVIFRTKKGKEQFEIEKKRQEEIKNKTPEKKKDKKYEPPKNGSIFVNSIIGRLDIANDNIIKGRDLSVDVKLGKNMQSSTNLQDPGKQLIWMDTFTFKRTWQETLKFVINVHINEDKKLPMYYTEVSLRDLFEFGRYMAKKLELKDDKNCYSGSLTIDLTFKEEEKPKEPPKKKVVKVEKTREQIEREEKEKKRSVIEERIRKRQEERKKREFDLKSEYPTFSERELSLPPIRKEKIRSINQIYNQGGLQCFSKSPRFQPKKQSPSSFSFSPSSDFESSRIKGPSIGSGKRVSIVEKNVVIPGVGRYQIPSVWDKYRFH